MRDIQFTVDLVPRAIFPSLPHDVNIKITKVVLKHYSGVKNKDVDAFNVIPFSFRS